MRVSGVTKYRVAGPPTLLFSPRMQGTTSTQFSAAGAGGVLLAVLVAIDAPNWTRLLIAIPAIGSASGYIQARVKFCAGFGSRGIFNFGEVGTTERVADDADRARDRARSRQIGAASIAIGLAAGVIAAALPI